MNDALKGKKRAESEHRCDPDENNRQLGNFTISFNAPDKLY